MSEMVERLAAAMLQAQLNRGPLQMRPYEPNELSYYDLARIAIEAIRKPSNKMLNAAASAMSLKNRPTQKRVSCKAKHGIRYRAMIDAALK